jgi:hypothetical protein
VDDVWKIIHLEQRSEMKSIKKFGLMCDVNSCFQCPIKS